MVVIGTLSPLLNNREGGFPPSGKGIKDTVTSLNCECCFELTPSPHVRSFILCLLLNISRRSKPMRPPDGHYFLWSQSTKRRVEDKTVRHGFMLRGGKLFWQGYRKVWGVLESFSFPLRKDYRNPNGSVKIKGYGPKRYV